MGLETGEFRRRQRRLQALLQERGHAVALAWSRGGATQDGYADVFYLSGFYTPQPYVPDLAGRWRAAGHAAVVVEADGPVTLVADTEHPHDPAPVADAVVVSADPAATVAELLAGRRAALLGGATLAARWAAGLSLAEDDELAYELRRLKSPAEQELLRAAGRLGAVAMRRALAAAVPGARESDVAAAFVAELARGGGALFGISLTSGPWAHTLAPTTATAGFTTRELAEGDLLRLDAYGSLDGYLFDFARTLVVGGGSHDAIEAVRDSVLAGIDVLAPGVPLGAVARRCDEVLARSRWARRHGFPASPMDGIWGHGLGLAFEPPWLDPASDVVAEPGMCLAVERRIEVPGAGAQYEDDVLVTEDGFELLTAQ